MAMDSAESIGETWEEIERSESYLVCSMYEEAALLSASILKRLSADSNNNNNSDMLESAAMVLVQSLKEVGRTSDILTELKQSFISVAVIPVEVLLISTCFQISEGFNSDVRKFLEEFLSNWNLVDESYYILGAERHTDYTKSCDGHFVLNVDKYLEVMEIYLQTLIETDLDGIDSAISWIEKAALPAEERQGFLRRLNSLHSPKAANSFHASSSPLLLDNHEAHPSSLKDVIISEASPKAIKDRYLPNGENSTREAVLKLSKRMQPCLWWFHSFTLKFGGVRLVISNGRIAIGCLILLMYFILRRKGTTLKRAARKQALSVKNALVDLWGLAFSYQVNPLAAVQPLPGSGHGGRQ